MLRVRAAATAAITSALVTALAFAPAVRGTLLDWDDRKNLVENTRYQGFSADSVTFAFSTFHLGPWQPLSWLSYTLDHAIWGGDPRGFYVTNVALHALAAALLALLAWRILPRVVPGLGERPALLAALSAVASLLWAAHPQRAESVAWATERRDVLSGAFLVGSALAWTRWAGRDADTAGGAGRWYRSGAWWAALLFFACSLLSKATAMGFVLVLVVLDLHPFRRRFRAVLVAEKVPFALAGLAVAAAAWFGQETSDATLSLDRLPLSARVVVAGATAAHHLAATVLPFGLRAHVQRPAPDAFFGPELVAGAAGALLLGVILFALRRRFPSPAAAYAVYLVLLAPVSGLALTGSHLYADRYSYQATLPLGLLAAGGLAVLLVRDPPRVRAPLALAAAGAAVFGYASGAALVTARWRSPETLWGNVLVHEPENWVAHEQLALTDHAKGDLAGAETHLVRSLASLPGRPVATRFLALVQVKLGRLHEAERTIEPLLAADPRDVAALRIAAMIAERRGDAEGALARYRAALAVNPLHTETLQSTAELLARTGRRDEAEAVAVRLVEASPAAAAPRVFLGSLAAARGDAARAEALFREAVAAEPNSALALRWLGGSLAERSRLDEAEPFLRRAVEVDPSSAESWATLAVVVARRGDPSAAADLSLRAAALLPDEPGPRQQAAAMLAQAGRRDEARAEAELARRAAAAKGDAAGVARADALLKKLDAK